MNSKVIGGILLVSGTTIGAAMLALPVSTGLAGFFPSLVLLIACWAFMTYTAFLILEANLWAGENANLISMARQTLGKWGEAVSWVTYLFLLYALTTAYIAGSGPIVASVIHGLTGYEVSAFVSAVPLLLLFGFFIYRGTSYVDHLNRVLMIGLVVAYVAMAALIAPHVQWPLLQHSEWPLLLIATSVVATSFGFHIIIPSLTTYLDHDLKKLKTTIFIGSLIPVIVYIIWEWLALGVIPLHGESGIIQGYIKGTNGAQLLSETIGSGMISVIARCFAFFAIITSFLGVSLSLCDFLADGFKIKKSRTGKFALCLLTFVPPLIFTLTDPRAFLSALEYAGAFGVIILLGFLPALMVWSGRYRHHFQSGFKTPGGKIALLFVMLFSVIIIGLEVANQFGLTKEWVK
jgi:tyrosine-specific transport protein